MSDGFSSDLSTKNANNARIRLWGENNLPRGQEVLVLRGKDALESYGNPQDVILTSDLPKPERTKYAKAQRANVRAFGWSPSSRWDAKFRHHLEEIPCPEEGVLVVLDNFSPRESGLETRIRSELVSSDRSEEHTSELQYAPLVCRLLLEKTNECSVHT